MARFVYNAALPMGQMAAEGVNHLQQGLAKITRAAETVTLMSEEQMAAEVGVPKENQPGFRSALNQLKAALEKPPFHNILPNLDQG